MRGPKSLFDAKVLSDYSMIAPLIRRLEAGSPSKGVLPPSSKRANPAT
jgi:hypothetical protein